MCDNPIIFNRDGAGGDEIRDAIGMIANGVDFAVWEPLLPLGLKDVAAIAGEETVRALCRFYEGGEVPDDDEFPPVTVIPLGYLKQAVAYFTWLKIIPTLDAQHGAAGRQARHGENEKGLTALEQWKDEENIRRLAYEYTELLVASLDRGLFRFWTESPTYRMRHGLLIRSKESFDRYYHTGSHRLYVTLLPMIREVQDCDITPVVGEKRMEALISGADPALEKIRDTACRALALLTIRKAVQRLPVEVLPEGIVQVSMTAPVRQRAAAEKAARDSVAASLGEDAARYLSLLSSAIAALDETDLRTYGHVTRPLVHSRGMSF